MDKFEQIPLELVTKPSNGIYRIYKDFYFAVTKDNCILKYKEMSYQCNSSEVVMHNLLSNYEEGTSIQQIPFVYIPYEVY